MVLKLSGDINSITKKADWNEQKLTEISQQLKSKNEALFDNEISGDKIDGGTITHFESTGIKDDAHTRKITINKDEIVVEGPMRVEGKFGATEIQYYKAVCDDLDVFNSVKINGREVLWENALGNSVKKSKLTEVGILRNLNVADILTVEGNRVGVNSVNPGGALGVAKDGLEIVVDVVENTPYVGTNTADKFAIGTNRTPTLFVSHDNRVGIKLKNPKEDLDVAGKIRYQGQTHQYGNKAPSDGSWEQGDICWNNEATPGKPLGWVCVKSGAPGSWSSIGNIS